MQKQLSCADLFRTLPAAEQIRRINALSDREAEALLYDWSWNARPDQLLPTSKPWIVWLILAGRGWGKTRTGAETAREWVKKYKYVNLIGATADDARDIMIEGESGILAICPKDERPRYVKSDRKLLWPNGAVSLIFTADEPERLRGKQHMKLLCDELAAWRYPESWEQASLGLRLGDNPQAVIMTTPRPTKIVKDLITDPNTFVTKGSTYDNKANLAVAFLKQIVTKYEGTRLGRQELHAEVLLDNPGSLWKRSDIEETRVRVYPDLTRIVVAIDPATTSNENSDETGIIVAGIATIKDVVHGFILDDKSMRGTPDEWAKEAVRLYHHWKADRIIGETNNGGDMIEAIIRTVDKNVSYKGVHASRGKKIRAEPISALYEQCIAEGMLVECENGSIPIELVKAGDRVWTREGLKKVVWAGQTGIKETIIINHELGVLECTSNHPVFCQHGFIDAGQIAPKKDILLGWKNKGTIAQSVLSQSGNQTASACLAQQEKDGKIIAINYSQEDLLWNLWDCVISRMQKVIGAPLDIMEECFCTGRYGNSITDYYQKVRMFITLMATQVTMKSRIYSACLLQSISSIIIKILSLQTVRSLMKVRVEKWQNPIKSDGKILNQKNIFANNASPLLKVERVEKLDFVRQPVTLNIGVGGVEKSTIKPVYNLHVEECHEYFAGGVLVHNCRVHHVGMFAQLEDQLCEWNPATDDVSPDRLDANVWALTELMTENQNTGFLDYYNNLAKKN